MSAPLILGSRPDPTSAPSIPTGEPSGMFDLNVETVEVVDPGSLVNVTNNGCGSTCGACVSSA